MFSGISKKNVALHQLLTTLRREWTSLTAVQALQFGEELRLVAHVVSYRGVRNVHKIKQDFIFSLMSLKEGVLTPDGYTSYAKLYRVFYSTSCEDWTAVENSF